MNQVMGLVAAVGGGAVAYMFFKAMMTTYKEQNDIKHPVNKYLIYLWTVLYGFGMVTFGLTSVWGLMKMFRLDESIFTTSEEQIEK